VSDEKIPAEAVRTLQLRTMKKTLALMQARNFVLDATIVAHDQKVDRLLGSFNRLEKTLEPLSIDPLDYYVSLLFVDLISEIELYFAEMLRIILLKHPKKIGAFQFKLSEIVESSNPQELVGRAAEEFLYKLLYKKPNEYLSEMCSVLSVDESVLQDSWSTYIEAKARRDLGTHNDWKCNRTYLRKLNEADIATQVNLGDSLLPSGAYFNSVLDVVLKIVGDLAEAVVEKHAPKE